MSTEPEKEQRARQYEIKDHIDLRHLFLTVGRLRPQDTQDANGIRCSHDSTDPSGTIGVFRKANEATHRNSEGDGNQSGRGSTSDRYAQGTS